MGESFSSWGGVLLKDCRLAFDELAPCNDRGQIVHTHLALSSSGGATGVKCWLRARLVNSEMNWHCAKGAGICPLPEPHRAGAECLRYVSLEAGDSPR